MTGHIVSHVVRRGMQHAQERFWDRQETMDRLQTDAAAYQNTDDDMKLKLAQFWPVALTALIGLLLLYSVDYTLGQVVSSLTMIESPSRTAIIDSKPPPAYTDEPDAPIEKENAVPSETADADIEVTLIDHKPITSKVRTTIRHLTTVGGFSARWRGLRLSFFYYLMHALATNFLGTIFGFGIFGEVLAYVFVSLGLARLHMAWTFSMIAHPSTTSFLRRMPARKECRAILLPTLIYALAQQATVLLPIAVAFLIGDSNMKPAKDAVHHEDCHKMMLLGLKFLAVPLTYIVVGLAVLFPASVTLTRVEAALLPENEQTIVPFDKDAIIGDIDVTARGSSKAIFVQAWRSFDRPARLRLVKLYAKLALVQIAIFVSTAHIVLAEIYLIGGEQLAVLFKSLAAKAKLQAMEGQN